MVRTQTRATPGVAVRPGLGIGRVVQAALGLVREHGIEALTMRRLADELGAAPMSLYRHVRDREHLVLSMLDEVARGISVPDVDDDPARELVAVLGGVHEAFRRDPWIVSVLVGDGLASPSILPVVERVLLALEKLGLRGEDVSAAHDLLWQYIYGETIAHGGARTGSYAQRMVAQAEPTQYPALTRTVRDAEPGADRDHFVRNVAVLVDGLALQGASHGDGQGHRGRARPSGDSWPPTERRTEP
ncbi:MAG: TetR/AcrR family transcriptional regulator [Phycicoccus sp.]